MPRKRLDFRGHAFRDVLGYTFGHWRTQPWRVGAIIVFALLSTAADLFTPLFAGRLVQAIAAGSPGEHAAYGQALAALGALIALGLASTGLRQLMYQTIIGMTLRVMSAVAASAFHRVQRLSSDWHANAFAGSTVRRITRGMWALDLLNDTLLLALLPSASVLVGATLLLGAHWPVMGLVVGLGSLLYIGVTVTLSLGYVAPSARLANAWDTRMGGALADSVTCNAVVKAFGAEEREERRLARVVHKWRRRTRRTWVRGTINGGVQGIMLILMQAAILGSVLWLWQTGQADAGDITFALTMFFVLQGYLREVGMHIRNLQRAVNDMEELVALEHEPLAVADRPGAPALQVRAGEIRYEHVRFGYDGAGAALFDELSVRIAPGERVGLVGPSGSGKTTFVKLIQRLYDVQAGAIRIDGADIAGVRQTSLRQQVAIVQQEPILFHRSLAENIAYGRPGASRAQIERAARLANAHEFIDRLPKGYDTLVGERGVKLSGGERQRVAIARAFLADAPILILDEATSSLDSDSEAMIQEAMERLMLGRTTLVIAHRLSTVRTLDRLLVFERGRIVEEGTHEALARREGGVYSHLLQLQNYVPEPAPTLSEPAPAA